MERTANSFRSFAFTWTCRRSSPLTFAKSAPPPMNFAPGSKQVSARRSSRQTAHSCMFVGQYSVAFAVRTEQNKLPLCVLFVAVQFHDYIWATLVLPGLEKP